MNPRRYFLNFWSLKVRFSVPNFNYFGFVLKAYCFNPYNNCIVYFCEKYVSRKDLFERFFLFLKVEGQVKGQLEPEVKIEAPAPAELIIFIDINQR